MPRRSSRGNGHALATHSSTHPVESVSRMVPNGGAHPYGAEGCRAWCRMVSSGNIEWWRT
eukprot:8238227-Pyramimonas_sp.AAC.2